MHRFLGFFFAFLFGFNSQAQNADIDLLKSINVDRNTNLDPTFRFLSNSIMPVSIGTPVIITAVGLISKQPSLRNQGLFIGEAFAVSSFVTLAMKYGIDRDRPFITYPFIQKMSDGGSPSFPSGHTSSAFSTATTLSIAFPKWYVIAPAFVWASGVGYSRMHLGVHYPSDVFVGAIIGSGTAFLTHYLNKKLLSKVGYVSPGEHAYW